MLGSLILAGVGALCMSNPRRRRKARRAKSRRRNPERKWSFERAKSAFPHRFTMEHVPDWAKQSFQAQGGSSRAYPAPAYRTDREWYDSTVFPGEPGNRSRKFARTSNQSWPLGKTLSAPYSRNPRRRRKARRAKSRRRNPREITASADARKVLLAAERQGVATNEELHAVTNARKRGDVDAYNRLMSAIARKLEARQSRNPRRGRKTCRNPKPRDLTEHEFTRGPAHVTIATWRNANATAFVAVTARGPGGVKTWEAKSQGPSSGGYSKPQQALERVFNQMTRDWPKTQSSTLINQIAGIAAEYVGGPQYDWKTQTNPRRRRNPKGVKLNKKAYVLQAYYPGSGWDDVLEEDTKEDVRRQMKTYRDNDRNTPYRWVSRHYKEISTNPRRRRSKRRAR